MQHNKEQNYLSMVIVLNNESRTINDFLRELAKFCFDKFTNFEFIIVDNMASAKVLSEVTEYLSHTDIHANMVKLPYQVNKEQAMIAGVEAAIGDYVFEFEDTKMDFSQDDLWEMYQTCLKGYDIVLLQPDYKTGFWVRKFYKWLARYSNKNNKLYLSTVHLISRRAINGVTNDKLFNYYRKQAYCNLGLPYKFLNYQSNHRKKNHKLSLKNIDFATDLLLLFTDIGKRITLTFALLFGLVSVIAVVYTIIAYFALNVISGWTTLMLLLSVSFTGIFSCFVIVIKYLNLLLRNNSNNVTLKSEKHRIGKL